MRFNKMRLSAIRAWATVDAQDGTIVALCATRQEAREHKQYASRRGWKQKIVKLTFEKEAR